MFKNVISRAHRSINLRKAFAAVNSERCDFCGIIVTMVHQYHKVVYKVPKIKHFHSDARRTICLPCSGKTEAEWEEAREIGSEMHAERYYPGSLNARWIY